MQTRQKRLRAHAKVTKAEDQGDDLIITGVASTNQIDRDGQIVDQESLAKAAKAAPALKLFFQHNWLAPIGKVLDIEPVDGQLWIRGQIGSDFEIPVNGTKISVNDIRKQISQGVIDAFSIGFAGEEVKSKDAEAPVLKVTDLFEISVVTIPANAQARFSVSKAASSPYSTDLDFCTEDPGFEVNDVFEIRFALDDQPDIPEIQLESVQVALEAIRGATLELRQDAAAEVEAKELLECLRGLTKSLRASRN